MNRRHPLHFWCYTKGSNSAFKVKVGMDNNLFDLRKIVMQKKRTTFVSIDAGHPILSLLMDNSAY